MADQLNLTPLKVNPADAELLRSMRDMGDAVAYAFAVPSLTRKPQILGIDWAKGFGPAFNKMEQNDAS